jgi:hypothetical protein
MNRLKLSVLFIFMLLSFFVRAQESQRLRVIVLTDIEADPDDHQSLIRFLLYSNQWDVEGLIATTSIHQKTRVAPESILDILAAYNKIQPNLLKHEKDFPSYENLKNRVKKGFPLYGMDAVGNGKDSEGSEWTVQILEKKDDRPVWFSVWGGANVLAQACGKQRDKNYSRSAKIDYYDKPAHNRINRP